MVRFSLDLFKVLIFLCLLIPTLWYCCEGYVTWIWKREWIFQFGNKDYLTTAFFLVPWIVGHLATIWGHYFRAEREFQNSITKVTTPVSVQQKISLWERHSFFGYTVKYWILVGALGLMKVSWILVSVLPRYKRYMRDSVYGGLGLIIGQCGGYAAIASCGLILFLVLRRSMLHALGFTYAEILPLHRWLGVAIVFWSTIHTIGYIMYYDWDNTLHEEFNFRDVGRATMNICGCIAFGALLILGAFSIPQIRRRLYGWFMVMHRVMTVLFILATIVHFPYYMLWYYLLPSVVLFIVDRFVPKMMQRRSITPAATCTFNADADIVRMVFTSPEPMKPYYPGDYILVEIPEIGVLYHPFTIASYWPEDPYSMTLFIRTYEDNKRSWTGALAQLCGSDDKKIRVKANIDGVFGDRRHDYLKSEFLVFFAAGAAITTFMALIKAIAAQIAASDDPLRMQVYLICTFRTRSELHAYGSFLHQITRDPRFTSWLHVEIYVSRPDKLQTLMGAHAHVIRNDIHVPVESIQKSRLNNKSKRLRASLRRTGTMLRRALSGRTIVETASSPSPVTEKSAGKAASTNDNNKNVSFTVAGSHVRSGSVDTVVVETEKKSETQSSSNSTSSPTVSIASSVSDAIVVAVDGEEQCPQEEEEDNAEEEAVIAPVYDSKPLPRFQDAHSASVAIQYAKLDLHVTTLLIVIPLVFWYILRAVKLEGSVHYCDVRGKMNPTQMKICYGSYSTVPVFGHLLVISLGGYLAMWLARRALLRSRVDIESGSSASASAALPFPDVAIEDEKLTVEDGNWDEADVVYSRGRINIKQVIHRFIKNDVGLPGSDRGLVSVFGGGPEAFVAHVEKQVHETRWAVDFHRETWQA
ncbi:ferric/cupric-chelate reductase [Podila humilis]|nr:ferric/cupric-chelate reductase [Podila humilis]